MTKGNLREVISKRHADAEVEDVVGVSLADNLVDHALGQRVPGAEEVGVLLLNEQSQCDNSVDDLVRQTNQLSHRHARTRQSAIYFHSFSTGKFLAVLCREPTAHLLEADAGAHGVGVIELEDAASGEVEDGDVAQVAKVEESELANNVDTDGLLLVVLK